MWSSVLPAYSAGSVAVVVLPTRTTFVTEPMVTLVGPEIVSTLTVSMPAPTFTFVVLIGSGEALP